MKLRLILVLSFFVAGCVNGDDQAVNPRPPKFSEAGAVDGYRASARFNSPSGLIFDKSGNLFVSDLNNQTIRRITPDGTVSTFAGRVGYIKSLDMKSSQDESLRTMTINGKAIDQKLIDGKSSDALFFYPSALAIDSASNLYVVETSFASCIRKITPEGVVTTFAGKPFIQKYVNGSGANARFSMLGGIAIDRQDNLYVSDEGNNAIRKITPNGIVSTFVGEKPESSGKSPKAEDANGILDGIGTQARLESPSALAIDRDGNLYVGDEWGTVIRKVTPEGVVTTLAGMPRDRDHANDGQGGAARFGGFLLAMAVDSAGNVYVTDSANSEIRKVSQQGEVSTFAGTFARFGNKDGTGSEARLMVPSAIAIDNQDNLYVADKATHTIRKITSQGAVTHFAGKFILGDYKRGEF